MENLLNLAIDATKKNVVKRTRPENINDAMLRILYEEDKGPMERTHLIARISLDRMIAEHGEAEVERLAAEERPKFDDMMEDYNKTVKNGVDTGVSNSNNNSAFSYNQKYKEYELIKEGSTLDIVKRSDKKSDDKKSKKK